MLYFHYISVAAALVYLFFQTDMKIRTPMVPEETKRWKVQQWISDSDQTPDISPKTILHWNEKMWA